MQTETKHFKEKTWFKVLSQDGKSIHGGNMQWSLPNGSPGEWHEVSGKVRCCSNGLHFTSDPKQWVATNCRFFIAEPDFSDYDFEDDDETSEKICVRKGRLLREATAQELYEYGIYLSGSHTLSNGTFYVAGNASVRALGNASVRALGNASVEAWENASVEAWENASVRALGNASVRALGNASVEAWGNASVEALGNASVEAWGNAYLLFYNDESKHNVADNAVKKSYYDKKIYIKKGSHQIVEVE